jgi:uncharacterized Zn-finger protein
LPRRTGTISPDFAEFIAENVAMVAKRKEGELKPACGEQEYEVHWEDLPLSCPTPEMKVWNAHPRQYVPVHRSGREACEYCGAVFVLHDPDPDQPMPMFDNQELEDAFRRAQQRVRDSQGRD